MGTSKGLYNPEYPEGSKVRIRSREILEEFLKNWAYHNKLQPKQLDYGGRIAEIESVAFYHGGDELYKLKDVPGIWHESCLQQVD
jgi:hypothetical protein